MTVMAETSYQMCHRHYGNLSHAATVARELLVKRGKPCVKSVKKLRNETDMPMAECADMLRCMWRDMELERLQNENAKLQANLNDMAGILVELARGQDEIGDRLNDGGNRIMPVIATYLHELGIGVE